MYHELETEHRGLVERHHTLEIKHHVLEVERQALDGKHQTLEVKHQALGEKYQTLEVERQALEAKHQALEVERQTLGEKYQTLEVERQALEEKYKTLEVKHQALGGKHQTLKAKHQALEVERQALEAKHQALEERYEDSQRANQNSTTYQEQSTVVKFVYGGGCVDLAVPLFIGITTENLLVAVKHFFKWTLTKECTKAYVKLRGRDELFELDEISCLRHFQGNAPVPIEMIEVKMICTPEPSETQGGAWSRFRGWFAK